MKMATVDKAKDLMYKLHKASWDSAIQRIIQRKTYTNFMQDCKRMCVN